MPRPRLECLVILALGLSLAVASSIFGGTAREVRADDSEDDAEKQEAQARKERYTNWMRTYAEETKVRLAAKDDGEEQLADLVPRPVFRYSDEQQRIPDGTLWVWTHHARPVAFQKVEGNNYGQMWTICFTSLSEGLLNVSWPNQRKYASRKPGVTFSPFSQAEAPADNPRARTAQLKALKDRFAARLIVNDDGNGAETRTMPKPLFEYSDSETKLPVGAIFGMSSTGTNPDLLLLIEARGDSDGKLRWEYAYARMTANGVRLRLDDAEIWAEKAVAAAAFENWIYYFLQREFP
ncbi:MAG: hypothetical protein ACM3U2_04815 [Deltaproteobacteria bacterium]